MNINEHPPEHRRVSFFRVSNPSVGGKVLAVRARHGFYSFSFMNRHQKRFCLENNKMPQPLIRLGHPFCLRQDLVFCYQRGCVEQFHTFLLGLRFIVGVEQDVAQLVSDGVLWGEGGSDGVKHILSTNV
jgi:hypothetical protein